MELALLVWLVDLLGNIKHMLGIIFGLLLLVAVLSILGYLIINEELNTKYAYWKTALFILGLNTLIPSEKTIQYMAGAYLIQTAYQSEFVNKASELGQKAILNQLSKWAEDNPEVKILLDTATEAKAN